MTPTPRLVSLAVLTGALALGMACDALQPVKFDEFELETGLDTPIDTDADTEVDTEVPEPVGGDNNAPRANAGPDQRDLEPGTPVLLDGSASSDLDGDPLDYEWRLLSQPPGSATSVTNATAVAAQIYVTHAGTYEVELFVSDGVDDDSDKVSLVVNEGNRVPTADAGFDQVVSVGATVQLSGARSADPDGDSLEYLWSFARRPSGSAATLVGATVQPAVSPRFTADRAGTFEVQLVVDDGEAQSQSDSVVITVQDTSSGGSGGSSSSDCLSCAEDTATTLRAGDAASSLGLLALPLFALLYHRRRDT